VRKSFSIITALTPQGTLTVSAEELEDLATMALLPEPDPDTLRLPLDAPQPVRLTIELV
jgi:hypothetical protein